MTLRLPLKNTHKSAHKPKEYLGPRICVSIYVDTQFPDGACEVAFRAEGLVEHPGFGQALSFKTVSSTYWLWVSAQSSPALQVSGVLKNYV